MSEAMTIKAKAPDRGSDLTYRDLSWFAQRVERGRKEIFSEIVTITPEIAKRLLEQNTDNRKLNERVISAIARDIKNGHWQLNGESIIVTRDGELNDGQNRLTAIIRAGLPVQSLIAFGVTRASRYTVDMGISRSASQFLSMNGIQNANKMAAISRLQLGILSGSPGGLVNVTKQDVVAKFNEEHDYFVIAYNEVGSTKFASSVGGGSFLPVAFLNINRVDSLNCTTFFDKLQSGANLEKTDPILWLRQRLYEIINTKQKTRAEGRLEYVLRYWNAWAVDAKMKAHIKLVGTYPKIKHAEDREK